MSNLNQSSTRTIFGLFGTGGFAREVMPLVRNFFSLTFPQKEADLVQVYFVETSPEHTLVNGTRVISEQEFFATRCEQKLFNIGISDSRLREKFANRCLSEGASPVTIQATNVTIYDGNELGEGAILCAFSMITSNARIGKFFHSNFYSYVAHDCVIGDYVTFAPRVHCNGNVHVGNHAYVGTCAVIKQGSPEKPLVIGEGAIVGMGAIVTKDVAPYTTVVGNPARVLEK